MSLDKSRIPKLGDSSRKFIPEKQRRAMTDPFVERITRTRTDNGETVSGRMVETRSQKSSEERTKNARSGVPSGPGHGREPGNTWTGGERKQKAGE